MITDNGKGRLIKAMTNEENLRSMDIQDFLAIDTHDLAVYLLDEKVNSRSITVIKTSDNAEFKARSQSDEDYGLALADAIAHEEQWLKKAAE